MHAVLRRTSVGESLAMLLADLATVTVTVIAVLAVVLRVLPTTFYSGTGEATETRRAGVETSAEGGGCVLHAAKHAIYMLTIYVLAY